MNDPADSHTSRADTASLADAALLRQYSTDGDQLSFATLVRRHSGWVFSVAVRRGVSPELAQECTQNVFLALARKSHRLDRMTSLTSWLHRAAVLETAALLRRESRYRQAMKRHLTESVIQHTPEEAATTWKAIRSEIDEALQSLSEADREILLLHHVEGRTFPEIALALGSTGAAAQRRGHRALEKLAARLRRCGVTFPMAALGVALASGMKAEAAQAHPVTSGILQAIAAGATPPATSSSSSFALPAWTASPAMLASIVIVTAGLPVWWGGNVPAAGIPQTPSPASDTHTALTISQTARTASMPSADSRLVFLRQALEELRKHAPSAEPTRLGLQLRKYMLGLTRGDLEAVGKLLAEVAGDEGEFPAILEAYSTRLAQVDPQLALELLTSGKEVRDGRSNGIRFNRMAIMDVLSRGPHLPEVVKLCGHDADLNTDLLRVWSTHDGPAAITHAEALLAESPELIDRAEAVAPWLMHDPSAVVKWLDAKAEAAPAIYSRMNSAFISLGSWAVQQMPTREAITMTLGLQDPVVRNDFIRGMFSAYSRTDPAVLAGLAPVLQLEDNARPLSVAQVVTAWRKKDEPAAASWVASLPEGELRTAAQRTLATPLPTKP